MSIFTKSLSAGTASALVLLLVPPSVFAEDAYMNGSVSSPEHGEVLLETETQMPVSGRTAPGADFSLTYEDVGAVTPREEKTQEEPPVSSEWVESEEDLRAFAGVVVRTQSHLEQLSVSREKVTLQIKDDAHLFGVISISLPVTIETDASGEVRIYYPWYSFAATGKGRASEASIKDSVSLIFENSELLTSEGGFTAYGQALVVDEVLEAYAKSEVATKTTLLYGAR